MYCRKIVQLIVILDRLVRARHADFVEAFLARTSGREV
jgi:hypothetical protein